MEPFEKEDQNQNEEETVTAEPEAEENAKPEPDSGFYRGAGVGQKETPFSSSPYVTYHPYQSYHTPQTESAASPKREEPAKPKKKTGMKVLKGILAAVLAVVLVVTSCGLTALIGGVYWNGKWSEQYDAMMHNLTEKNNILQNQIDALEDKLSTGGGILETPGETLTAGEIYRRNVNSVVALTCVIGTDAYAAASAGTGFVMREDGYIITNHHVVAGASRITVTMADGTNYAAVLIGSDATNDVALIKVNAQGLTPVTFGSSSDMKVGDQVIAIGNALGELSSSLTVGYVSGIDRKISTDGSVIQMLQTDVAINSGNSGGPLFNARGEVIGITTAKYSGTTSTGASIEGISFAIPMDDVMGMLEDLRDFGYVRSGYLGIMAQDVDMDVAEYYGFPVGAYVYAVVPGYCAEAAGIQAKDIIVEVGGYKVTCMSDLSRALRQFEAGDTVTVKLWRGGREVLVQVTLDEKPKV